VLAVLALLVGVAGCTGSRAGGRLWHGGRLFLATGNTTGVYYQLGGGFADIVTRNLPGYEARAEPTGASGENISRVASGDMDVAFSLADTAADAATGKGAFQGRPQSIKALATVYRNYTHVIVRTAANIHSVAQMKGRRVSTGSPNSGTDVIAGRLLEAAGLDPDNDVQRLRVSLPETVKGLRGGTIDAMFFSGGLPTPGIADLMANGAGQFTFLPLDDLLNPLNAEYGAVYTVAPIPKSAYGTQDDVPTIVVANLIVVSADMPEQLAYDLTRLLFEHQDELSQVHPEGGNFQRQNASRTDPVPLHPGAERYYREN